VDGKKEEETRSDYENATRQMMAQCMEQTDKPNGDPAGYSFHHFALLSATIHSVTIHCLSYGGIVDIKPVKQRQDL
jgi:hypothetical protein